MSEFNEYMAIATLDGEPMIVMPVSQLGVHSLKPVNDSEAVSIARLGMIEFFMAQPMLAMASFMQTPHVSVRRSKMGERPDFGSIETAKLGATNHLVTDDNHHMQWLWDNSVEIARLAMPAMLLDWDEQGPVYDPDLSPDEVGGRLEDFHAAVEYWNGRMYDGVRHVSDDRFKDAVDRTVIDVLLYLQLSVDSHRRAMEHEENGESAIAHDYSALVGAEADRIVAGARAESLLIALRQEGVVQDNVDDSMVDDIVSGLEALLNGGES
jgi:hypothetical protein